MRGTFTLIHMAFAISIMYFGLEVAYANDLVVLTTDQTATLDLTTKAGASVDLLECNLRVVEENGNLYLLHSKGKLPIPRLASSK
jgi:hypothetical protein